MCFIFTGNEISGSKFPLRIGCSSVIAKDIPMLLPGAAKMSREMGGGEDVDTEVVLLLSVGH